MRRLLGIVAVVAAVGLLMALPVTGEGTNLIVNGSFEQDGGGGVGAGWTPFNNGGHSQYGYALDTREATLFDGSRSQLVAIKGGGVEADRYAGIYQTVQVVPGADYHLTIHGVVCSTEGSPEASGYGYRVQWAIDYSGGSDWQALDPSAWHELDWYEWPLDAPGYLETFSTDIKATSGKLTLFIRGWKKWRTANSEGHFSFDGISLVGPAPTGQQQQQQQGAQLPTTGAGLILPGVGVLLGVAALARAGRLLLAHRRTRGF